MKIALVAACLVVFGACDAVDPSIPAKQEMKAPSLAQTVPPATPTPGKVHPWEAGDRSITYDGSGADHEFIRKTAERALAQVEFGNLVLSKGTHTEVRNLGWRMASDYSMLNRQLARLAETEKITLPTALRADHQNVLSNLTKASGAEFDEAYLIQMERGEPNGFEWASTSATDPDVKAFAWQALTIVRDHQALVKEAAEAWRRDKNRVISIQ